MYAIIEESGRQVKVQEGQELRVDFLADAAQGDEIVFDKVLAVRGEDGFHVGQPILEAARVTGEVLGTEQGNKLVIQKFRRRKNSRRRTGHRQTYTRVKINKIDVQ